MPAISKIRFTNVVYEGGNKRYNDELFQFDGHNGAILLENGGGKTVFIQTALQAVLPHADLAGRKMKDTLSLENGPAHIAVEWILHERPRRYAVTCVSLFLTATGIDSYRYVYDYPALDSDGIEQIPFVREQSGRLRAADKGEIHDYYQAMTHKKMNASMPPTIKEYKKILEKDYHIIATEWERIAKINGSEGGVESFFDECKTTSQLFDRLLIPTVEDAMSGYEQGEFADAFEAHRDGFKKYKELKEKIAENQLILQELERYVRAYAKLDRKQRGYEASQSEAKGYWLFAGAQKLEEEAKLVRLREQLDECGRKLAKLAQKRDSLHIAAQRQELSAMDEKLRLAGEDTERLERQLRRVKQDYYSIRLAEYKQQALQAEETLKYVQDELDQLGSTQEESELRAAWSRNSGQVRALFAEAEERRSSEQEELQAQLAAQMSRMELEQRAIEELSGQAAEWRTRQAANRTMMEVRGRDREQIGRSVLANPAVDSVEAALPEWVQRHRQLDESNVVLAQKNKELLSGKEESAAQLERTNASLRLELAERMNWEGKLDTFRQAREQILTVLGNYRASWARLASVYDKQSSIEEMLRDDAAKLGKEKEALLFKERIAYRYVDDYAEQDAFFADVYVAGLAEKWKNRFSLLETGVQYAQSMAQTDVRASDYPLWSVTLVTTEHEVQELTQRLRREADHLQYPIQVISAQQASALVNLGESRDMNLAWVEPSHWAGNQDSAAFAEWKQAVRDRGHVIQTERKQKEEEQMRTADVQNAFGRFIAQYPLEHAQELEQQVAEKRELVRRLEASSEQLGKQVRQAEREIEQHLKLIQEQKEEMTELQQRIEKGRTYLELGKEIQVLQAENDQLQEQLDAWQSKINSHQRAIAHVGSLRETAQQRLDSVRVELASLRSQELYAEVADAQPVPSSHSLEWLRTERRDLHLKLNRISQGRQQLEEKAQYAKKTKATAQKEISKLRQEHADLHLNEQLELAVSGSEEEMNGLLQEQREQEQRLERARGDYRRVEAEAHALKARIELLVEQFAKEHSQQPMVFFEPLSRVREQVQQEEKLLHDEQRGLQQLHAQIAAQSAKAQEALDYLAPYKIMHGFENSQVKAQTLAQEAQTEFLYDRLKIAKGVMLRLLTRHEELQIEEKALRKAKGHFIDFCRKQVKDVKTRETAEQGIEQKESYAEVEAFWQTMRTRIERVNHIAEESMRTHNQQLEQFIVYVHGHLKLIASELRDIPNKTKVRVEDQWKHIFTFQIPEWEELEARERIRAHVEWILGELDKDRYRDDSGQEFKSAVRKDMEKWLDTKQLLQIVMQERPMKVSCRKVTNENNVTKASFSWEQSNNWSGGEKWSKNMTLFLGLLNYVAEKRQHIQAHMKRHRTVILDNPFGKASSDHVLSPVFFIAEQLGFQIIALTAHAEGKFLKDYFPVVFSCRLRQASGSSKQVMTKEKEINQAYFRDHAPVSLERLGDVKQLELFM